jgi:hypothetical protein
MPVARAATMSVHRAHSFNTIKYADKLAAGSTVPPQAVRGRGVTYNEIGLFPSLHPFSVLHPLFHFKTLHYKPK